MAEQRIMHGPGNTNPLREYRQFKANGAITKGEFVAFYGTTGYTVDQANITTMRAIGVATETAADGEWFNVQIAGHCNYITNDGTDVVALDYLCSDASAHAVPYTTAELSTAGGTEGFEFHCIGQSLEAETGTTCTNVMLYKHI